jgi:hypothetical protein
MTPRVIMNWIVQPHIDIVRLTSRLWQYRRSGRGKRDVLDVARETFQRWQERHSKGGKRDILKVERKTFQRWQE